MNIQEVINIASKFDAKGFKQAETASQKLGRTVKNLAGTLGLAFGTAAVVAYGKASVKVALEAQAEQERLNNILKVTTGATQAQIDVLNQQATALERIGVVTAGNIKTTQSQLATFDLQISTIKTLTPAILDYVTAEKGATASASDFKSMTNGLAQALNGNFGSLTRTGFVLDEVTKNTIKNGTETERATALVKVLNSTYKDFNANLRNTDAGKMQVLANTAEEVQTIIGTGIINSLKLLSGDKTIENLANNMKSFATAVSDTTVGFALFINELKKIPILGKALGAAFDNLGTGLIFTQMGKAYRERLEYNKNEHKAKERILTVDKQIDRIDKDKVLRQKRILAAKAKEVALAKKLTAEMKQQEILDQASAILAQGQLLFDEEGIQLAAAAMGTLSEEDRVRLALKTDIYNLEQAIAQGNIAAAAALAESLVNNAQQLAILRGDMENLNGVPNPFLAWLETLRQMVAVLNSIRNPAPVFGNPVYSGDELYQYNGLPISQVPGSTSSSGQGFGGGEFDYNLTPDTPLYGYNSMSQQGMAATVVNVNVAGSLMAQKDLENVIIQAVNGASSSGTDLTALRIS